MLDTIRKNIDLWAHYLEPFSYGIEGNVEYIAFIRTLNAPSDSTGRELLFKWIGSVPEKLLARLYDIVFSIASIENNYLLLDDMNNNQTDLKVKYFSVIYMNIGLIFLNMVYIYYFIDILDEDLEPFRKFIRDIGRGLDDIYKPMYQSIAVNWFDRNLCKNEENQRIIQTWVDANPENTLTIVPLTVLNRYILHNLGILVSGQLGRIRVEGDKVSIINNPYNKLINMVRYIYFKTPNTTLNMELFCYTEGEVEAEQEEEKYALIPNEVPNELMRPKCQGSDGTLYAPLISLELKLLQEPHLYATLENEIMEEYNRLTINGNVSTLNCICDFFTEKTEEMKAYIKDRKWDDLEGHDRAYFEALFSFFLTPNKPSIEELNVLLENRN
jgi:hypothetical protein